METVLIADRDLGFVLWLAQRLNQHGHHALPAMNEDQAAQMAEQFEFNVLVIDASFPDSAAFARSLRSSRRQLKVFVLSANHEARSEQVRQLEIALRRASSRGLHAVAPGEFGGSAELSSGKLAASRAALTGVLVGAALWAVLIALVIPR